MPTPVMNIKGIKAGDIYPVMEICDGGVAVTTGGALTIGWELTLPVAYTQTEGEYDNMILNFNAAVKGLDPWTVVHRQDVYLYEEYETPGYISEFRRSFLGEAYERHFRGRRHMTHRAYLFLTYGSRNLIEKGGKSSGVFGIHGKAPAVDSEILFNFTSKADRFITTLENSGQIRMRRLERRDWLGEGEDVGIVQRYMMLGDTSPVMSDIGITRSTVTVGNKMAQCFTIAESDRLPNVLSSTSLVTELSTTNSSVFLSMGSKLGLLLDCEHVVNQIIVVPEQDRIKRELEAENKKMQSGLRSRDNAVNHEAIEEFLTSVEANSDYTVRVHTDVIAWSAPEDAMKLNSRVSASIAGILNNTKGVYNRFNTPVIWYGTIPGCACELGEENMMTLPLLPSLLLGTYETFFKGLDGGLLPFSDRMTHVPVSFDFHKVAHDDYHLIDDYNMFVCGPTGSGKSFFTNYYARNCYDNGESVFIIDVGDSYEVLCNIINEESGGRDGQYFSWDVEHPFSFNPFVGYKSWLDENGNLKMDESGVNFIISFLQTVWSPSEGWKPASAAILRQTIADFLKHIMDPKTKISGMAVLDDYYRYVAKTVKPLILKGKYRVGESDVDNERFDVGDYLLALKAYSSEGEFSFLMNNPSPADLFTSRFVIFEVDALSNVNDDKEKKFYSLCILCIMNAFDIKMRSMTDTTHKNLIVEEAWKAIANETMAPYLKGLWKTSRKFRTSAIVVTQEINDILSSDVIKESILRNSSMKVLLDQKRNKDKLPEIGQMLGLQDKELDLIQSINRGSMGGYYYKEAYVSLMGNYSCIVANEVSPEEAVAYESEKTKKQPVLDMAREMGSYIEAVKRKVEEKNQKS